MNLFLFFPFDPTTDTSLGHRHLVLAYGVVWGVQLCYLAYLLRQWKSAATGSSGPRDRSER